MKKIFLPVLLCTLAGITASAQSEGLTGSPYSMYGLGSLQQAGTGISNALGRGGIALPGDTGINNLNPASYASIYGKSFLFDVGFQSEYNHFENRLSDENKWSFNFSNIAMAFHVSDRSVLGITLTPYSNVGYTMLGVTTNIEGSDQQFESTITGSGGLNSIKLNYGYRLSDRLRLGASASYLFGSIEENEFFSIGSSYFEMSKTSYYNGARLGAGFQYDLSPKLTLGGTVLFPVKLSGSADRSVLKTIDGQSISVEDESGDAIPGFKLPTEMGMGILLKPFKGLSVNADYRKNLWSDTHQNDNLGSFKDQDIISFGAEYVRNTRSMEYTDHIRFRAGFTTDNGYLSINGKKIGGYAVTAGLGLPISSNTGSMLNLSYSYGQKGQVSTLLIRENYHFFTLNISLEDLWFVRRKYE